jgi:hypothetical protein
MRQEYAHAYEATLEAGLRSRDQTIDIRVGLAPHRFHAQDLASAVCRTPVHFLAADRRTLIRRAGLDIGNEGQKLFDAVGRGPQALRR